MFNLPPFEVRRKCPGNNDKRKQSRQSVPLLPSLPAFHLMSPAESQSRVGGFATLPSLLSSARSLLSDSPLFYLSSLFLDPPGTLSSGPSLEWVSPLAVILTGVALTFLRSRVRLVSVPPPPLWNCLICLELCRDSQGFCAILKVHFSFTISTFQHKSVFIYINCFIAI